MTKKALMHVISHTHWDREWYQSFQGYRRRLVHQIDAMLDLMEKRPEYKYFHLDGQTAVLGDYVQIRPNNRERLAALVRAGRVLVGPWFVMPDEGLLSGESLVRNLMLGHRHSRQWGGQAMPVGFVSDVFGHVSQLPQILAGFGIDTAWLHRGTGQGEKEKTELLWVGADGTQTLIAKAYQATGYQDFKDLRDSDEKTLLEYEAGKLARSHTSVLFGMDGNDHEPARWDTPEAIERLNGIFKHTQAIHSTLPGYFAQLKAALGANWQRKLQRFEGELRHEAVGGVWSEVFHGTGSARVILKQANDEIEYLLARVAEPLNAWAARLGADNQKAFLDLAWQYLMLNHPHDSICGCSIDQVHNDMLYRFDQARMLGRNAAEEAMQDVADRIDSAALAGDGHVVTVFNLANADAGPVCRFEVELPAGMAERNKKEGKTIVLTDENNRRVPAQLVNQVEQVRAEPFLYKFQGTSPQMRVRIGAVDRFEVLAEMHVPALGYRTFKVGFAEKPAEGVSAVKSDEKSKSIENEFLRLVARPDGRIDLYDKTTRTWFRGLNEFEDCGDAGHGWDHMYPDKDTVVRSTDGGHLEIKRIEVQAKTCTAEMTVSLSMKIPADLLDSDGNGLSPGQTKGSRRSSKLGGYILLILEYSLTAGSRRLDCKLKNMDYGSRHRLRAIFPTGRKTAVWYGDTAFDLVRRNIKLPDGKGWVEQPRPEQPIKNLVAVCDDKAGLAILTKGLNEAAVLDKPNRPMALTLYRNFVERLLNENTADSDKAPRCVEYALLPFTPDKSAPPADILKQVDLYKLPLLAYTRSPSLMEQDRKTSRYDTPNAIDPAAHPALAAVLKNRPPLVPSLPLAGGLVKIDGPAALSTIKTSEDGSATILRLWNPLPRPAKISIRPSFSFGRAFKTDMQENATERLAHQDGEIALTLRGKEVVTVRIE